MKLVQLHRIPNVDDPSQHGFNTWVPGLRVDEQVTSQALAVEREFEDLFRLQNQPLNDAILWRLIRMGLFDPKEFDRPMDASTRSMRYSAVTTARLWKALQREVERVRFLFARRLSLANKKR